MIGKLITKRRLIKEFANEIAALQRTADVWYYERNDQEHSSWLLDRSSAVSCMALSLGICKEVTEEAHKIYDFTNSGRKGYTLKDGKIVKCEEGNECKK